MSSSTDSKPMRRLGLSVSLVAVALLALTGYMAWRLWRTQISIAWNWNSATAPIHERGGVFAWWSGASAAGAETAEELVATINFDNKPIGDADVAEMVRLYPKLGGIQLANTQITDEALRLLETCSNLGYVKLDGTQVSPEAVQRLSTARDCWFAHPTAGIFAPASAAEAEVRRVVARQNVPITHPKFGRIGPDDAEDKSE